MKTKTLNLIVLLFLICFLSCGDKKDKTDNTISTDQNLTTTKDSKQDSPKDCRLGDSDHSSEELLLDLKFNCDTTRFEPLHLDLVNSIGLLGRVKIENGKVLNMKALLKEAGACSRYDLHEVKYLREEIKNGQKLHHFIAKIEAGTNPDKAVDVSFKNEDGDLIEVEFKKGDIIDIHIDSKDPKIRTWNSQQHLTRFGQQFCRSIVTGP